VKIWIVTQTLVRKPGGVSTHARLLHQGLRFNGVESTLISLDLIPRALLRVAVSVPLRALNAVRRGTGVEWAVGMQSRLLAGLMQKHTRREGKPDVFACQDTASVFAAQAMQRRWGLDTEVLLTVHSAYGYEKVAQGWALPSTSGERRILDLERKALLAADLIVAVSEPMRAHVYGLIGSSVRRTVVLPNAVDVERFSPAASARQRGRCRRQFRLQEDIPVLLIAGNLLEVKGVPYAVEAAAILRDRGHDFRMVIAGDGPLRAQVEALIARHRLEGHVWLIGVVSHDRMPALLRASDVLVMPSIPTYRAEESFGLSAVEAMATGIPVVASRTGGLGELVRDGQTGLVVPPASAEELADALSLLLVDTDYRESLGAAARDYAVSHHDHVAHALQYASLARSAVAPQAGAAVVRLAG